MPGELKETAVCPKCGDGLLVLSDATSSNGVIREYYHQRMPDRAGRRPPCFDKFPDIEAAHAERRALEAAR